MLINSTLFIVFSIFDIILKNSKISFYLFVCFLLNFIIFGSRTTSIWYHNITSIQDHIIIFVLRQFGIKA